MQPVPEHLSNMLCDVILDAINTGREPAPVAEKAAKAYAAGLAAFKADAKPARDRTQTGAGGVGGASFETTTNASE